MARTLASLVVKITTESAQLVTGIQKALGSIKVLSSVATGVGKALKGMVGSIASALISARGAVVAFAAAFVAGKIARSFQETAENIEKIYRTSKRLGLATEEVSAMRYAAEQAGVEFDTLAAMMSKGAKNIAELAGGGRSSVGLGGMVLQLRDANGELLPMSELFPQIVAAISNTKSQAEKLNLANQIFGREGGAQFVDWLADTGDLVGDLAAKMKEAKDLGIVFTDEQAAKVKAYGDAANKVSQAFFGIKASILIALAPALTAASEAFAAFLAKVGKLVNGIGKAVTLWFQRPDLRDGLTYYLELIWEMAWDRIRFGIALLWKKTLNLLSALVSASSAELKLFAANIGAAIFPPLRSMFKTEYAKMEREAGETDWMGTFKAKLEEGGAKIQEWAAKQPARFTPMFASVTELLQGLFAEIDGMESRVAGPKAGGNGGKATVPPFMQGILEGLRELREEAENLQRLGKTLTTTFIDGFSDRLSEGLARGEIRIRNFGRAVTRILGDVSQQLIKIALNAAFTRALAGIGDAWANSAPKNTAPGGVGPIPQAQGGAWNNGRIQAFGDGGVTDRPTFFATAMGRLGVMGEKNQPEGIFPLKRMPSGDLGVQASGSTSVQIIDQRGAQAPAAEVRRQPAAGGGENITVIIRDAVKSAIGNGSLDRVLGLRYGLTPAGR